ncbi:MAG: class IV adenylate cyclase [Terriglobia bacterium]
MRSGTRETEIKLAVASAAAARRRLRALGFRLLTPRRLERNWVYDTPARTLKARGCLLRLRTVGRKHWLTFKSPAAHARHFKVRREFEVELRDNQLVEKILAGLGFQPVFRYEKFRATFAARRRLSRRGRDWPGGVVTLDETPIGVFLELEGSRVWIRRVARALGAHPAQFITQNYASLYAAWCRRRKRRPTHMVFRPRRRGLS